MNASPTSLFRALLVATLLAAVAGCSNAPPLPKTYPAKGQVVYKGGQPMAGGAIQFTANAGDDPLIRILGVIESDGTFTLYTMKDKLKERGAPAGEYKVQIVPPPREALISGQKTVAHKGSPEIALPQSYIIEPNENVLRIELSTPPPG